MAAMPVWLKMAIWYRWDGGCSLSELMHYPEIYFNDEETPDAEFWEGSECPREPEMTDSEDITEMYVEEDAWDSEDDE
mgnify:FL=1